MHFWLQFQHSFGPLDIQYGFSATKEVRNYKTKVQAAYWMDMARMHITFPPTKMNKRQQHNPPVYLNLISEKSIWENQVYFKLDFFCLCSLQTSILKLIFAGQKSSSSNLIFPTCLFKIEVQRNRGNGF